MKMNRALTPIYRGVHHIGGGQGGKVEPVEHDYADWERRVDALMVLCTGVKGKPRLMSVDELRKNIESLPPKDYDALGYYEKWITSLTQSLIQRGLITTADLVRKMNEVQKRGDA